MGGISQKKRFFPTSVTLGIIFLILIFLYGLFFIYPSYRAFSQTRQAVLVQMAKLERLKILYPVFARSNALGRSKFEHRLPFPRRVEIHRNELTKLSRKISDTAKQNNLAMSGSDFDINSLRNQSQSVSMGIKLKGNLFDFRQFLIDIIAFEFFDSIDYFGIYTNEGQTKDFTLNLNIKIKKSGHE